MFRKGDIVTWNDPVRVKDLDRVGISGNSAKKLRAATKLEIFQDSDEEHSYVIVEGQKWYLETAWLVLSSGITMEDTRTYLEAVANYV